MIDSGSSRRSRSRAAVVAAAVLALTAGCGRSSSGGSVNTKAQWSSRNKAAITAVSMQLDFARSALDKGQRDLILSACNLLQDDLTQARRALPVPNPSVNAALQRGLDAIATGDTDCIQGARVATNAGLNEKAMAELTDARARMDAADQAIANWS